MLQIEKLHYFIRIGFDQKVRFESVGSKFESNSNPCFSYNLTVTYSPDVILEQCLTIFGAENRQKLHKNEYFRGKFYENRRKLHQNDNFRGRFLKNSTLSDSNPDFGFYGVEIFTRFEAGFE